jgi:uncharacterized protein (DUF1501 family)
MSPSRRDFLRQTGCALTAAAFASGLEHFGLIGALAQQAPATDYKALVCVFLNGGNDGNNLVVPLDAEYSAYSTVRSASGLAIPQASLLPVTPATGGRSFGLHPSMPDMQTLFNQQRLAIVANVGPLVEPITRAQYQSSPSKRPYQLFSHSDQVTQWMTSVSTGPAQTGWGGRTADSTAGLNGTTTFPMMTSIAGVNVFVAGLNSRPLAISDARTPLNQVLVLSMSGGTQAERDARRAVMDALRQLDNENQLVNASSDTMTSSLQISQTLSSNPTFAAADFPDTNLGYQLEQVAKIISLRDALGIKRQIFFCSIGGFDTHANQRGANGNTQDNLLTQVSQAIKAFYDKTVQLGVANSVTTFTLSDFGRTLQPAGAGAGVGSDHAWGNHHLVIGGAVRGGDMYGTFPTLALGGPNDTDTRGRWIPTTSVEQYAATLATWYGLSSADLSTVFPLINRFSPTTMTFMT